MFFFALLLVVATAASAIPQEYPSTITVYGVESPAQKPVTLYEVKSRPVIVLAAVDDLPDTHKYGHSYSGKSLPQFNFYGKVFTAYYLHYGLGSVKDYESFTPLYDYFTKSQSLSGVVFFPESYFSTSFLKNYVSKVVLEENFSLGDFFKALSYPVPVFLVGAQKEFPIYDFKGFTDIGTFVFANSTYAPEISNFAPVPFQPAPAGSSFPFYEGFQYPQQHGAFNYPTVVIPLREIRSSVEASEKPITPSHSGIVPTRVVHE